MSDPFSDPSASSGYPKVAELVGHLVLLRPTRFEERLLNQHFSKPDKPVYNDRVTADVIVLDGPLGEHDDTQWDDMWITNSRLTSQLRRSVDKQVLGRVELRYPDKPVGQGNPYGLVPPSEDDRKLARKFLAEEEEKAKTEENPFEV
jgi:hypothetical protein